MADRYPGLRRTLLLFMLLGLMAGIFAADIRLRAEGRNRRVELALEWAEIFTLAQSTGRQPAQILGEFRSVGLRTLVVAEDTVAGLESAGGLKAARSLGADGKPVTRVSAAAPADVDRIRNALTLRRVNALQGSGGVGRTIFSAPGAPPLEVNAEYVSLRNMGLGLNPDAVRAANDARLLIAGRLANYPGVSADTARRVLEGAHAQGARLIIFNGDDVMGYRGLEQQVGAVLRDPDAPSHEGEPAPTGLLYGAVEFGKQRGEDKLISPIQGGYIRVHSIQAAEIGQMSSNDAIERFVRAVRERNIRFCYIRLFTMAGPGAVEENVDFVRHIAEGMERGWEWNGGGFEFGAAHPFGGLNLSKLLFALLGVGTAAALVFALLSTVPAPYAQAQMGFWLLAIVLGAAAAAGGQMGRKLVALLAGIIFPTIACLAVYPGRRGEAARRGVGASLRGALLGLGHASLITAVGILYVIGLLASRTFMVKADQFLGIKAQHTVPLLIIALLILLGGASAAEENGAAFVARVRGRLRDIGGEPLRWGSVLALGVALVALMIVVARSGNDANMGVSGLEMKFRSVLEAISVRPRTKEFLIGHPAMVLGLAFWLRGRRKLALPIFLVGCLGQVSILNTFCHIHTPLAVSLLRDLLGLALGAAVGSLLFLAYERLAPAPVELHDPRA